MKLEEADRGSGQPSDEREGSAGKGSAVIPKHV